jgi:nitrogen-specific signal transduction histidine kinase
MDDIHLLRESFDAFQQSSDRLQAVYAELQEKVAKAAVELEAKNAELIRINAEREAMHRYLQGILESLTVGVLVADESGVVHIANHTAQLFLAGGEEPLVGRSICQIFGDIGLVEGGRDNAGLSKSRRLTVDGRVLELLGSPLANPQEGYGSVAWVATDISETLKLEKQARHVEKNSAMLELAAQIAHEVRNPLGSIELFSSLLLRHLTEAKQRDWVDQIIQAVKSIDAKIEELLRHVKTVEPLMELMNVHDILREVLLYSDRIADQGHVFLAVEYDPGEPLVRGNPAMLRQIFMGLVLNALKSLSEEGRIHIRTTIEDQREDAAVVRIRFSDNRPGDPAEHIQRFFNPDDDDERMTSINFAVLHNIVALHKGSLSAESGDDGTTAFSIAFPLVKP